MKNQCGHYPYIKIVTAIRRLPELENLVQKKKKPVVPLEKVGVKRKESPGRRKKDHYNNDNTDKKDTAISQLHAAITKANEERLALENATRDNLKQMEKIIMTKVETMIKTLNNSRLVIRRWRQPYTPFTKAN